MGDERMENIRRHKQTDMSSEHPRIRPDGTFLLGGDENESINERMDNDIYKRDTSGDGSDLDTMEPAFHLEIRGVMMVEVMWVVCLIVLLILYIQALTLLYLMSEDENDG